MTDRLPITVFMWQNSTTDVDRSYYTAMPFLDLSSFYTLATSILFFLLLFLLRLKDINPVPSLHSLLLSIPLLTSE
jgi:hypothetical protein